MSRKFTLPLKFKNIPNTKELIEWYEDKLLIMENRQNSLSEKITYLHKQKNGEVL
ncbi:MAG TPA: hypothetical protein VMZ91_14300 [Candidatus Paceibacterota bacterium]|nr:hypothetical protein [Candidatus Paceibacterota bacterium]